MANDMDENGLAKAAVIDQLIMEHSNKMPTMSATILAYSIDQPTRTKGLLMPTK